MKYYLFFTVIIILYACNNKPIHGTAISLHELSQPIGEEQEQIVQDLKTLYAIPEESRSNSPLMSNFIYNFSTNIDNYQLNKFDYYRFDLDGFYTNPSTEKLQQYLTPSEEIFLVASREGKMEYNVILKYDGNIRMWTATRLIPNYQEIIGWLPDSLANAETQDFKVFTVGEKEFITYNRGGEPRYFKITGEAFTPGQLGEFLVEEYKQGQIMQQILQNQTKASAKES